MKIWNGKKKAFTLSYDDAVESDIRLVSILNRYGLKATFNVNSGIIGTDDSWKFGDFTVRRLSLEGIQDLYQGHEIAVHGVKHLNPGELGARELEAEFLQDKIALEEIFHTEIKGMAYPYGVYNDLVVETLEHMGLAYGRTVEESHGFGLQENSRMRFQPTCHHKDEKVFELLDRFIAMEPEHPQLFYLWGHSYEFDGDHNWELIEDICKKISGHEDIFYGTNAQVFGIE